MAGKITSMNSAGANQQLRDVYDRSRTPVYAIIHTIEPEDKQHRLERDLTDLLTSAACIQAAVYVRGQEHEAETEFILRARKQSLNYDRLSGRRMA